MHSNKHFLPWCYRNARTLKNSSQHQLFMIFFSLKKKKAYFMCFLQIITPIQTDSLLTCVAHLVAVCLSSPSDHNRTFWLQGCPHTPPTWLPRRTLWSPDRPGLAPPTGSPSRRTKPKSFPMETLRELSLDSLLWWTARSRCIQIRWGPRSEPPPGCRPPHPWSSKAEPPGTGPSWAWFESGCLPPQRPGRWYSAGPIPQN